MRNATTGSAGSYRFTDLDPGAYTVVATVSVAGFSYTTDTDGVGTAMPVVLAFTGFATERSLVLAVALLCAGGCAEIALHRTRRKRPA